MGLINLKPNQVIHKKGEKVETVEIVLKGKVSAGAGNDPIILEAGGVIGAVDHPGQPYDYTFTAVEESVVFSYPYNSRKDLEKIVESNPKIAPVLAAQIIKTIISSVDRTALDFEQIKADYETVMNNALSYPMLAVSVGSDVQDFPELDEIEPPKMLYALSPWQESFYRGLMANEEAMKKHVYSSSIPVANGIFLYGIEALAYVSACREQLAEYKADFNKKSARFRSAFHLVMAKKEDMKRNGSEGVQTDVDIKNALNTILQYAGADEESTENFRQAVEDFKLCLGRYDSSDESRTLRRRVSLDFYTIYTSAFLRSLSDPMVPSEVMMFLMFGFVDEELAGLEYTRQLYVIMKTYKPDPDGVVLTMYEWLKKIYFSEVEPSKNEFDEDYFTALKTMKINGEIDEEEMELLKTDQVERLKFEVKNLFALGNRITFGRPSLFVPVFDAQNVIKPFDKAYIDYPKIHEFFEHIRTIDFSVFCRQGIYSNPEIGITQVFLNEDVTPYVILMPNMGSRASVWQEIEGKRRNTPARFIISIFHTDSFEDVMIKLCGEFRWEMCKTEQGVHWNDVTDPSITSMYCDYLQFYKKNHSLSAEMKEKVKTQLQKYNNNYKNLFVSDYYSYIKFEANSSPRLNKVARDIMFNFCPFTRELRDKMKDNPQYTELIKRHNAHTAGQLRPLSNMIKMLRKDEIELPEEMVTQWEFFQK